MYTTHVYVYIHKSVCLCVCVSACARDCGILSNLRQKVYPAKAGKS